MLDQESGGKIMKHLSLKKVISKRYVHNLRWCLGGSMHGSPAKSGSTSPLTNALDTLDDSRPSPNGVTANEAMAWELLYDLNHRLPTADAELAWSDATGATDVMAEPPLPEGLAPTEVCAFSVCLSCIPAFEVSSHEQSSLRSIYWHHSKTVH